MLEQQHVGVAIVTQKMSAEANNLQGHLDIARELYHPQHSATASADACHCCCIHSLLPHQAAAAHAILAVGCQLHCFSLIKYNALLSMTMH